MVLGLGGGGNLCAFVGLCGGGWGCPLASACLSSFSWRMASLWSGVRTMVLMSRPSSLSRMSLLSAEVRMMSRLLPGVTLMLGTGVTPRGRPLRGGWAVTG